VSVNQGGSAGKSLNNNDATRNKSAVRKLASGIEVETLKITLVALVYPPGTLWFGG
jgi:hypothetical protein